MVSINLQDIFANCASYNLIWKSFYTYKHSTSSDTTLSKQEIATKLRLKGNNKHLTATNTILKTT